MFWCINMWEGPTGTILSGYVFLRGDAVTHSFHSAVMIARQQMNQAAVGSKQENGYMFVGKEGWNRNTAEI